jgi:hypothetical protein
VGVSESIIGGVDDGSLAPCRPGAIILVHVYKIDPPDRDWKDIKSLPRLGFLSVFS